MATKKTVSVDSAVGVSPADAAPAKTYKPAPVPVVGLEISKDGKSGQIIWEGDQGAGKVFKVRWSDGTVAFHTAADLVG